DVDPALPTWIVEVFFFSSRRRNTSFSRDWSSDVCSSDLPADEQAALAGERMHPHDRVRGLVLGRDEPLAPGLFGRVDVLGRDGKIGRASCRERVWSLAVDGTVK